MDRLTAKGEQGAYLLCTGDYEDMVDEAIDRLAAYEDTGLEPEQIKNSITDANDMAKIAMALRKLRKYEDTGLTPEAIECMKSSLLGEISAEIAGEQGVVDMSRAKEIAKAESEGRLIVLPCKVGDTVWQVHPSYYGARQVTYHSAAGIVEDMEKGWGIGNTLKEAEAALGGNGDA